MEIRDLQQSDADTLRTVARESLTESYSHALEEDEIETVVDQWYDEDAFDELHSSEDTLVFLAENDAVAGFVQAEIVAGETVVGDIHWLHVRPDERGEGVGSQLLGETLDRMEGDGVTVVRGEVLEVNQDGINFYEEQGFSESSTNTVDVGEKTFDEIVLERTISEGREEVLEVIEGPDGQELIVDYAAGETGVIAPLYPTYLDKSRDEQFGYLCGNCNSTETTMGTNGRIECSHCENARKATRWDDSYL